MGYIEHSLGQSETLIYRARFPAAYFVAAWGVLLASVLAALLLNASGYGPLWIALVLMGVAATAVCFDPFPFRRLVARPGS